MLLLKKLLFSPIKVLFRKKIEKVLMRKQEQLPKHLGVILDGNRRWAKSKRLNVSLGHEAGAANVIKFLFWCEKFNIDTVTLWMLSTDNLGRKIEELMPLFDIIVRTVKKISSNRAYDVKIIGALQKLPMQIRDSLLEIEKENTLNRTSETAKKDVTDIAHDNNEKMKVNIAIAYDGRQEIVDAFKKYVQQKENVAITQKKFMEEFDEQEFEKYLYLPFSPLDLIIRTSGEYRLSGFLLWQSSKSELYFSQKNWPDFNYDDFLIALYDFTKRQRRMGK